MTDEPPEGSTARRDRLQREVQGLRPPFADMDDEELAAWIEEQAEAAPDRPPAAPAPVDVDVVRAELAAMPQAEQDALLADAEAAVAELAAMTPRQRAALDRKIAEELRGP